MSAHYAANISSRSLMIPLALLMFPSPPYTHTLKGLFTETEGVYPSLSALTSINHGITVNSILTP